MPEVTELILKMPLENAFARGVIGLLPVVIRADEIAGDRAVIVGVGLVEAAGRLVGENVEFRRHVLATRWFNGEKDEYNDQLARSASFVSVIRFGSK